MALRPVDSLSEEGPHRAAGQLVLVEFAIGDRRRHVVGGGMIGPQPGPGDHLANRLVVGSVLRELLPQPVRKAVATIDHELPRFVADETAGQSLGEVVGKSTVGEQSGRPLIEPIGRGVRLEDANFFQRGDRAAERERQASQHLQLVGPGRPACEALSFHADSK